MRITFVGPVPPFLGGIAHHSARFVDALRGLGHDVVVVSWRTQYPQLLYRGQQRDDTIAPYPGARFILRWWNIYSWWRVRKIAHGSELLVFPYVTPFLAIPQRTMAGGSENVVAIVHNAMPHEHMPFERSLARLALRKPNLLIAHGEGVADDIRALGVNSEINVVPMPPTLEIRPSVMPARPPLRLLFFGFVRPYKGVGVAISSMVELAKAGLDARLTVMGDFWEPVDQFRNQIEELGLSTRVELRVGYVSDYDLSEALAEHHIVVAPYLEDTLSGVVPVAFAAGRPVVSTLVRGVSEQVADQINGILVAPGDPNAFAEGVIKAAESLERLATGAAASSLSWDSVAAAVTEPFD
jgi:glycosyltransferase involved in cell wall biosynthesis